MSAGLMRLSSILGSVIQRTVLSPLDFLNGMQCQFRNKSSSDSVVSN